VDYSEGAIDLAKSVAHNEEMTCINYQVTDYGTHDLTLLIKVTAAEHIVLI
jgi:hypothetical protein